MTIHHTKNVYAPPEAEDGMRVIVMRRYPRGVAKSRAHAWLPALAPTLPLVQWYQAHREPVVDQWRIKDPERYEKEIAKVWRTFSARYVREMNGKDQRHLIDFFASLHRDFDLTLTLLCTCPEHPLCHRSLLSELIVAA